MKKRLTGDYYVGLDISPTSVGYAATNEQYELLKHKQQPMWGVHIFDEGQLCKDRTAARCARRTLDRRQQRVRLVQEIFAPEIYPLDPEFFLRIKESRLFGEEASTEKVRFAGPGITDKEYRQEYPTIHHLISRLMTDQTPADVRLVYMACAWLVSHRGHSYKEIAVDRVEEITQIEGVYNDFMALFDVEKPWDDVDLKQFGDILKGRMPKAVKYTMLCNLLYNAPKAPKATAASEFPYSREGIIKLLCGSAYMVKKLYNNEELDELKSITLDADEERFDAALDALGEDGELLIRLRDLYEWGVLCDILQGHKYISEAKIQTYETHKADLELLKRMVKIYLPTKYDEIFRQYLGKDAANYVAYSGMFPKGVEKTAVMKKANQEEFNKYIAGLFKDIKPCEEDEEDMEDMRGRLELGVFMPKQVSIENRVIPYQIYYVEMRRLLDTAAAYLPFLREKDEEGFTAEEKLLSIMRFSIPYYVGPLNSNSKAAWFKRKEDGPIRPWNFEQKVDLDASEQGFISRMTASCTYLPAEDEMPKMSLLYEKVQVLNEINAININGERISVKAKKLIYNQLYLNNKNVTIKQIKELLLQNGLYTKKEVAAFGGMETNPKNLLISYNAFKRVLTTGVLTETEVEEIIEHGAYCKDRPRLQKWIACRFPQLAPEDVQYLARQKMDGFGRMSRRFLDGIVGMKLETGEVGTIAEWLWNHNVTMMELLSREYNFTSIVEEERREFFAGKSLSLQERLDALYVNNRVKRPIIRAIDIMEDVVKVNGKAPFRIFVIMEREFLAEDNSKTGKSRYDRLQALYDEALGKKENRGGKKNKKEIRNEAIISAVEHMRELLDGMGERRDNLLQSDKIYLYFLQLGKCMYTGNDIPFQDIRSKVYNIDHIYPRRKVKDESILNNKVLVMTGINEDKSDEYPLDPNIQARMFAWWDLLHDSKIMGDEKYRRLVRTTPFTKAEEWGFISREFEVSKVSTKAIISVLRDKYPQTEVIAVNSGLVADFRQEFELPKSRAVNDLWYAKDAFLAVPIGNVYHERFTQQWFLSTGDKYSIKTRNVFSWNIENNGIRVWSGNESLEPIRATVLNNNAIHYTRYLHNKTGGLFNATLYPAGTGAIEIKQGMDTAKYGGYNDAAAQFFVLARFSDKSVPKLLFVPVEAQHGEKYLSDANFAKEYLRKYLERYVGRKVTDISMPLGDRVLKIKTMFEVDGVFRMTLTGKAGERAIFAPITPLIIGSEWEDYIRRLERFCEKKVLNPKLKYDPEYNGFDAEKNLELYDLLCDKLERKPFDRRPNNPVEQLRSGRKLFIGLDIQEQPAVLLRVVSLFSKLGGGRDLTAIGGKPAGGASTMSMAMNNWKKKYADVRILDTSASGLFTQRSCNLLDLI